MATFFIQETTWSSLSTDQHGALVHCPEETFLGSGSSWLNPQGVLFRVFDDEELTPADAARLGCSLENLGEFPDFEPTGTHAEIHSGVVDFCDNHGIVYNDPDGDYEDPWSAACSNNTARSDVFAANGIPVGWAPYNP